MTFRSMMTWGHMIWIFFPIPLFCLCLLALPLPRKLEKLGARLVGRIFFTQVSVGVLYVKLVWVFLGMSMVIFGLATRVVQVGFHSAHVPCNGSFCPHHVGETMYFRRAARYRAERNFWLSLFTLVLWLLVYKIFTLKEKIIKLKDDHDKLRKDMETIRSDGYTDSKPSAPKSDGSGVKTD